MEWQTKLESIDDRRGWEESFALLPKRVSTNKVVWLKKVLRHTVETWGYGGTTVTHSYREFDPSLPLVYLPGNLYTNWADYDKHFPHQLAWQPLQPSHRVDALDWLDKHYKLNEDWTLIEEPYVHKPIWAFKDSGVAIKFRMRFV